MNFFSYIKEKWYMFILSFAAFAFSIVVYILGKKFNNLDSDILYILYGIFFFYVVYIVIDYLICSTRVKKMTAFISNGAQEEVDSFFPSDNKYYDLIGNLTKEYNAFRSNAAIEYANDLDFVTKWVHDVKVPISAMKLLLESEQDDAKERLEMELASIEQSTQNVLYNIKSRSFYDDYKIEKINAKKMIGTALKQFATFFSYKKIRLNIVGDEHNVLTDIKWSGYIVSQFISNAIKHTKEGGEIEISTERKEKSIVVSVRNTGEGIEKADIKNIFNRGYTAASRLSAYSTGYGLYLAQKLAQKLGHKLLAESQEGIYAKFSIIFFDSDSF
jgi:signal transduction histidine kinase